MWKQEIEDFADKTDNFVQNSYILMVGYLLASIISTIGSIIVIRLISVEENSLIVIAFIIPTILIPIGELGLNYASTYFIAIKKKENDIVGVKNIIRINLTLKIVIGLIFTISIASVSMFIAKYVYHINDERLILLMQISSLSIFSTLLYEAINSFFLGAQKMKLVQMGAIIKTSSRSILSIVLVQFGYTLLGPTLGYTLSSLFVVFIYLFFLKRIYRNGESKKAEVPLKKEFSNMIKYGHPLMIFSVIAGVESQIFFMILAITGYLNEVGLFQVAIISAALIGIFTKSIDYSLFPIFSKLNWKDENERKVLTYYFQFSIKFGTLLLVPMTIFLIIFSGEIFPIIFGIQYREASIFISVYFLIFLVIPIGSLTIRAFFNGQKYTKNNLYIEIIFLVSGVSFGLILINLFGALGLIIGLVIGKVISIIYGNIIIRRKFGDELFNNSKKLAMIFLIAIIGGIIVYFIYNLFLIIIPINEILINIIVLMITLIIYYGLFLILIGIFSLVSISEIDFLVKSFEKFPIINRVIHFLANIEKKIINLSSK